MLQRVAANFSRPSDTMVSANDLIANSTLEVEPL